MKMLITGGNRGLGKHLVETFNGISVSRENGLDITQLEHIKQIAAQSLEFDIFVNNAFDGPPHESWANFAQTNLYLEIYEQWKNAGKHGYIFNIGSIGSQSIVAPNPKFETYRISKAALDHASRQGSMAFKQNQINFKTTLIVPDRLDTPLTRSRPTWTGNGIDCDDVANAMKFVMSCQGNTCVEQIIVSCNYSYSNN